jgi:hypothetical protein
VAWLLEPSRTPRQLCLCGPHRSAYVHCCITRATQYWLTDGGAADRRARAISSRGELLLMAPSHAGPLRASPRQRCIHRPSRAPATSATIRRLHLNPVN